MSFMHLLYSPAEIARNVGENAKTLRLSKNLSRKTFAENRVCLSPRSSDLR